MTSPRDCARCYEWASITATENFRDQFGAWPETDADLAEVDSATRFMLDDAVANGVACDAHR